MTTSQSSLFDGPGRVHRDAHDSVTGVPAYPSVTNGTQGMQTTVRCTSVLLCGAERRVPSYSRFIKPTTVAHVLQRIQFDPSGCWLWTGRKTSVYGQLRLKRLPDGREIVTSTHRFMYHMAWGVEPEGYDIDHTCGRFLCVNPFHLEAVPHSVNIRRGFDRKSAGTTCEHGERLRSKCRACKRKNWNAWRARIRAVTA